MVRNIPPVPDVSNDFLLKEWLELVYSELTDNSKLIGSFTMTAASASTVIEDTNIKSTSSIFISPTNQAAASMQGSTQYIYVSDKTAGTSFTVTTADGTNALGTESFDYLIINT